MKLYELTQIILLGTRIKIIGHTKKSVDNPYYDGLINDFKNEDIEHMEIECVSVPSTDKMLIMLED